MNSGAGQYLLEPDVVLLLGLVLHLGLPIGLEVPEDDGVEHGGTVVEDVVPEVVAVQPVEVACLAAQGVVGDGVAVGLDHRVLEPAQDRHHVVRRVPVYQLLHRELHREGVQVRVEHAHVVDYSGSRQEVLHIDVHGHQEVDILVQPHERVGSGLDRDELLPHADVPVYLELAVLVGQHIVNRLQFLPDLVCPHLDYSLNLLSLFLALDGNFYHLLRAPT